MLHCSTGLPVASAVGGVLFFLSCSYVRAWVRGCVEASSKARAPTTSHYDSWLIFLAIRAIAHAQESGWHTQDNRGQGRRVCGGGRLPCGKAYMEPSTSRMTA